MTEIEQLYEDIFCSQDGQEHREELLDKYKYRLVDLANEHKKSGIKVNGIAISFENLRGQNNG